MSCRGFKPEIFFTLPVNGVVFALACTSLITSDWVGGSATYQDDGTSDSRLDFNYGLFKGKKDVQLRGSTLSWDLSRKKSYPFSQKDQCLLILP